MIDAIAARPQEAMRLRARSFMAFVLTPSQPISEWLAQLDKWSGNSPNFFAGRPIILDLAGTSVAVSEIAPLITQLAARGIRIMALEGADANQLTPSLPPLLLSTLEIEVLIPHPGGERVSSVCRAVA